MRILRFFHAPGSHIDPDSPPTGFWLPVGLAFLAGISTALGACVVLLLDGTPSKATMCFALALAGSVMVYVSVEMSVTAVLSGGALMWWGIGSILVGCATFFAMRLLLPDEHDHDPKEKPADEEQPLVGQADKDLETVRNWRLGVLMLLVLSAHNFPEGLAVAASAMDSSRLGIIVAVAIAAHNIPEGIVIAVPVYAASKSRLKAIGWALASGLTEPLGALVAVAFLRPVITETGLQAVLCLVAGMMLAVSVVELFPAAWKYEEPTAFLVGLAAGVAIMATTDYLVE